MATLVEECTAKLASNLRLTTEEDEGVIIEEKEVISVEEGRLSLVGKLLSSRFIGREVVSETMGAAWDSEIASNAKNGGPWHIDNNLLVLEQFNGELRPSEYGFNKTAFWIQVEDPPKKYMTLRCAENIGNKCGKFVEWDTGNDSIIWGRRLRIRVEININKPLLRGINLRSMYGTATWVDFKYEKLPHYCQWCGVIGHRMPECTRKMEDLEAGRHVEPQYTGDMRASNAKGGRTKRSQSPESVPNSQGFTAAPPEREDQLRTEIRRAENTEPGKESGAKNTEDIMQLVVSTNNLVNVPINLESRRETDIFELPNQKLGADFRGSQLSNQKKMVLGSRNCVGPETTQSSMGKTWDLNQTPQEKSKKKYRKFKSPKSRVLNHDEDGASRQSRGKRKFVQEDGEITSHSKKKQMMEIGSDNSFDCPTVVAVQPRGEH